MYWFYILPLGFLLTMYTITGYDASAHVSEETHGAASRRRRASGARSSTRRSIGWIVLLALTFAVQKGTTPRSTPRRLPGDRDPRDGAELGRGEGRPDHLDGRPAVLRDGLRDERSRMTFAFSRDGAVPGHRLWRRLGPNRTPTWAVLFVVVFALLVTLPAFFPNKRRLPGRLLRGHLDLGDRALHRLHDPGLPALADGRRVRGGAVDARPASTSGSIRSPSSGSAICVIIFCLPTSPAGVFFGNGFSWSSASTTRRW